MLVLTADYPFPLMHVVCMCCSCHLPPPKNNKRYPLEFLEAGKDTL